MLRPEFDEVFQSIYDKAVEKNPEIKDVLIVYNTHAAEGVEVGKGTDDDAGTYRISCEGDNSNPDYTVSSFALGLALIIYDIKYGEYDYNTMSDEERAKFDNLFHEFFPESSMIENLHIE